MAKRKNRHLEILKEVLPRLEQKGFEATVFHHHRRMPKSLAGVPDLYLMHAGISWWIAIKPRYANYMRDQMSDVQWQWYHDRRPHLGTHLRYAIVDGANQLLDFVLDTNRGVHSPYDCQWAEDYHWNRYHEWRKGR